MKVYIAGRITGDENYKAKFEAAKRYLENEFNFTVLNPAVMPEGMKPADYMRICFAMLDTADMVVFLPDYKESKGAMLERAWCEYTGRPFLYFGEVKDAFSDRRHKEWPEREKCERRGANG